MARFLHIVLRHRKSPNPRYENKWLDDDRIQSITTYPEIADLCSAIAGTASRVRIHRTSSPFGPAQICCEAGVQAVRPAKNYFEVEFCSQRALHLRPYFQPDGKKSYYWADVEDTGPESVAAEEPGQDGEQRLHVADPICGASHHIALLQDGIDAWNFARTRKPEVRPNLAGADLREALAKAGRYVAVHLANAELSGACLAGLSFVEPIAQGANFERANLTSATWTGARNPEPISLQILKSRRVNLEGANLTAADLSRTKFEKPCLQGASFRGAILVDADLSGSQLSGICFDQADMRRANLRDSDLKGASFAGTDLRGADLSTAIVTREQIAQSVTDHTTRKPVDWAF